MAYKEQIFEDSPRIQHLEDLIFWDGKKGATVALKTLNRVIHSKHNETTTVKWDGCIHPDLLIQTDKGKLRIEEIIDRYNTGEKFLVLGYDIKTHNDIMIPLTNAIKKNGKKDWVLIELENGEELRLTEDHEVFTTNRGWVAAGKLTNKDDIKESSK